MTCLSRSQFVLPVLITASLWAACNDSDPDSAQSAGTGGAAHSVAGAGGAGGKSGASGKGAAGKGRVSVTDDRELKIRFRGKVLQKDLSCSGTFDGVGKKSTQVVPVDFRFFVQDLALVDRAGNRTPVIMQELPPWQTTDVALIDLTDVSGSCVGTEETNDVILAKAPPGEYTGIAFRNGVPEPLNHEDPVLHPPPLQVTDLAWSWLTGFRFVVAEVHQSPESIGENASDADSNGGVGLVHIGSTACKANLGCGHRNRNEIVLDDFDPDTDVVVADLGALFADVDVTEDVQCHASSDACSPMFARAGLDWETGDSLSTQSLFRVEPSE
jgi:uncharacterized repeat protein (TIGR04052 family)